MAENDTPNSPSEALHPFTAVDDNGITQFVYKKSEVDRYLLYYKDAVDERARALQDEIARLQTVSGSERLWLVSYQAVLSSGSIRLGHCALHSNRTGEALLKEAYVACVREYPSETEIVLCSMCDLGVSVESVNTYSGVVTRKG